MRRLNFLPALPILFATSVAAMSISSIIKQAEVIKVNAVIAATSTAITVSTTIRGFAANDPYQIKTLDVPKTTYMTRLKAGMGETGGLKSLVKRNAWYAGWIATMAAAGWAIDELTGQVVSTNGVAFNYAGYCSVWMNSTGTVYTNIGLTESSADCISKVKAYKYYYSYWGRDVIPFTSAVNTFNENPIHGQGYVIYISPVPVTNAPFTGTFYAAFRPNNDNPPVAQTSPVPDDAIFDSIITKMLEDPLAAAQAFMVPDAWPYPYPQVFPDTVPYVPGVAESDEEALNWYLQGLAQSTNPNAPYYVSPEKLQDIASLAQALQQGLTPEGQVDELNENLKSPLTQSQLEESLKKRDAENKKEAEEISATDKKPITDAYKDSGTKDEYDKLKERVSDPSKLPQLPPLPAVDQIDLPIHTPCRTITTNMFNAVLTFPNPDQCTKLEQVKTGLGYLLYVLTALGIVFELYRRVE